MKEILIVLGTLITVVLAIAVVQAKIGSDSPNERLKIWLGYWKFIFGTFVIGLVTTLVNWQIQTAEIERDGKIKDKELELTETTQENENLKNYIQYALTKDLETRRAFANYFAHVSKNPDTQERWRTYADFVENEYRLVEKQKAEAEKELELERNKTKELESQLASWESSDERALSKLTNELLAARQSQIALERQLEILQAELKTSTPLPTSKFEVEERTLRNVIDDAAVVENTLTVETRNSSVKIAPNRWEWTVFLTGEEAELARIQCVQYTLHPTFNDPVKEVCERGAGDKAFPLTATGWGTFPIKLRILKNDGNVELLTHDLTFYR
jgi:hypothetical protein